ncbi:hypothetical protein FA95DRAFT_1611676 [Auriscalpium vulgare]|uniref:Uncharacterized protein n=1 Tax=Auriscalpium vulgare TaxID=40419 RepID=A0ACB8R8W4_9AGAM|nr:hypothetical protein FA95DRAFT_1611676 [Auriscalpium vulgare]
MPPKQQPYNGQSQSSQSHTNPSGSQHDAPYGQPQQQAGPGAQPYAYYAPPPQGSYAALQPSASAYGGYPVAPNPPHVTPYSQGASYGNPNNATNPAYHPTHSVGGSSAYQVPSYGLPPSATPGPYAPPYWQGTFQNTTYEPYGPGPSQKDVVAPPGPYGVSYAEGYPAAGGDRQGAHFLSLTAHRLARLTRFL